MEEVLLPGVGALEDGSAEHGFAWRWATGWLAAARRVAPPATREEGVVLFDAGVPGELGSLRVQALELALRRRGLRTLVLAAALDAARVASALHAVRPRAVVLAGRGRVARRRSRGSSTPRGARAATASPCSTSRARCRRRARAPSCASGRGRGAACEHVLAVLDGRPAVAPRGAARRRRLTLSRPPRAR